MNYRLAVEDIEPGHWIAWALDLPGCYGRGVTAAEAVSDAPLAIATYYEWAGRRDPLLPRVPGAVDVNVIERFSAVSLPDAPEYLINACFQDDHRPLAYWDVAVAMRLLDWAYQDLDAVLASVNSDKLARPSHRDRVTVAGLVTHIADTENWYFDRLGLGLLKEGLPDELRQRLAVVQANTRAQSPYLVENERVMEHEGETWTARKVLRRALWHIRDHTRQLDRLLTADHLAKL